MAKRHTKHYLELSQEEALILSNILEDVDRKNPDTYSRVTKDMDLPGNGDEYIVRELEGITEELDEIAFRV